MFYIVVSDLDGTLLSPKFNLTEYTKRIIRKLVNKGIYFVISTGRHYKEAIKIKNNLNISCFLITSNGARIYNLKNKLIYSCDIDSKIVQGVINKYFLDKEVSIQLYTHENWYINKENYKVPLSYFLSSFRSKKLELKYLSKKNVSKIFFVCKNLDKLLFIRKDILNNWNDFLSLSFSSQVCLEVMSKFVSKGYALKYITNILGLTLKDCISFGDGENDKEMLEISGKGCIVYNGCDILKNSLPNLEIIGSNKHDSVAEYLNDVYSLNK